jgi:hypothetical protein
MMTWNCFSQCSGFRQDPQPIFILRARNTPFNLPQVAQLDLPRLVKNQLSVEAANSIAQRDVVYVLCCKSKFQASKNLYIRSPNGHSVF